MSYETRAKHTLTSLVNLLYCLGTLERHPGRTWMAGFFETTLPMLEKLYMQAPPLPFIPLPAAAPAPGNVPPALGNVATALGNVLPASGKAPASKPSPAVLPVQSSAQAGARQGPSGPGAQLPSKPGVTGLGGVVQMRQHGPVPAHTPSDIQRWQQEQQQGQLGAYSTQPGRSALAGVPSILPGSPRTTPLAAQPAAELKQRPVHTHPLASWSAAASSQTGAAQPTPYGPPVLSRGAMQVGLVAEKLAEALAALRVTPPAPWTYAFLSECTTSCF